MRPEGPLRDVPFAVFAATPWPERCRGDSRGDTCPVASSP